MPLFALAATGWAAVVVGTGQDRCYDTVAEIPCPSVGEPFFGQDANYQGKTPSYRDNNDGTVLDLNTGLLWTKRVDPVKVSLVEAEAIAKTMHLAGHGDWRVPNIKELYSLIDFRGYTGFAAGPPNMFVIPGNAVPFINTHVFSFRYGDIQNGERFIDAQWLSNTRYVSTTMRGDQTLFGVNFADGRIKGYGYRRPGRMVDDKKFYVRYVRGPAYGGNDFVDNRDGTVSDRSSGLMWSQKDSGWGMTWEQALRYARESTLAGYQDWRLPHAKELHSIVDYSRSPDTTHSPAIDPVFATTAITNEAGQRDYPYFWTSTTHKDGPRPAMKAVYFAFGRAIGRMDSQILDVHGAGAQRSDPKVGVPRLGHGPQGDAQRIMNWVRLVRGGDVTPANP
ncbi:MAG: DUF1566 domain-containing protein [Magnetococcales bacterium]|nr:DUF1566 domain-containing protein [Magnetococcales bacterium]